MLRITKILFVFFFIVFLFSNCNQSATEPSINGNLIQNGSFEINNSPTLEGWQFGNRKLADLINEAPPDGGNWSLELTSDGSPTMGYAYTQINNVKSGDILQLTAYVKAVNQDGGGIIRLGKFSAETSATIWNKLTLIDTLDLEPCDTLKIFLSSPITQIVPRKGLFDLITLERIGSR